MISIENGSILQFSFFLCFICLFFFFFFVLIAPPDPCVVYKPCRNGALCQSTGNQFICRCQLGFTGQICDTGKLALFLEKNKSYSDAAI